MGYLVFNVSQIKNVQYDIEKITQRIEVIDSKLDLNETSALIKSTMNSSNKPRLTKLNYQNYKYYMDYELSKENLVYNKVNQ